MAQPFVLDVNLQIQEILGLNNVKQQLSSVAGSSAQVNVGAQGVNQTNVALGSTAKAATSAAVAINAVSSAQTKSITTTTASNAAIHRGASLFDNYSNRVALAGARYSAFVIATAVPFAGLAVIGQATQSIIELDAAMVKLSQVLRQPQEDIDALRKEIIRLSVDTGTSIKQISESALTLAQAGFLNGPKDFAKFLEPLSKVPLLPTFKDIDQATEGIIASLSQFGKAGLEPIDVLDKLTRVADRFAVESADLIEGLRRAGGTFSALGGDLDEFLAIFTTIRSTTRESAEAIATSLKTISARLAQPATLTFLESIGISVRDQKGELLGLIDIFKNVGEVFNQSSKEQQAAIGTQLGGLRNIGRVFAGLQNPDLTQNVLAVSRASAGAVSESAAKGLEKISTQIDLLVARFNELAQSLAKPIFVPFIEGALTLGNALVTVLDAIKPVLPLFVQLISLAAGLKVFGVAASAVKGLAASLASINIGGLPQLGGFLGPGARSVAGPGQGVIPVGGIGARNITGAGAIAGSQIGQLGALLGLNLIAGKLSDSFEKTDNSVIKLGAETLSTATALFGLASIASGKSLTDLFKSLGLLGGTLLGIGALGIGAVSALTSQTSINIDELVSKAAKEINSLNIQVSPGDKLELDDAISKITRPIASTFSSIAEEFDPNTFKGSIKTISERLKSIFTGDISKGLGLDLSDEIKGNVSITNEESDKIIKEIIGDNPKILSDIIKESITEFGTNFQAGLQGEIEKTLEPFSDIIDVKALSSKIRERIIQSVGGFRVIPDLRIQAERDVADKAIVESTKRIADSLKNIILPQSLGSELLRLTEVVKRTVESIDSSVSSFDNLSSTIGKIETPQISTSVTPEAVRRSIESGNLDLGTGFDTLDTATQKILITQRAISDFTNSLLISLGDIERQVGIGGISASDIINNFVNEFLSKSKGLPPEAQSAIKSSAGLISSELEQSLVDSKIGIDPTKLKDIIKSALGGFGDVSNEVVNQVQSLIEAQIRLSNTQNKARDLEAQIITSESVRPITILQSLSDTLEGLGITGLRVSDRIDEAQDAIGRIDQGLAISKLLFEELGPAIEERNRLEAELREATIENASNIGQLTDQFAESSAKVREIKKAFAEVGKIADIASSKIGGEDVDELQAKQTKDQLDTIKEISGLAAKLTELDAATESSRIFESANVKFSRSVDKFEATIIRSSNGTQNESNIRFLPQTNLDTTASFKNEIQDIFQNQLENQRSFSQNISHVGTAIALFSRTTLNSILGNDLFNTKLSQAPFDQNQFTQAMKDTIAQIAINNTNNPNLASNPLAFLGTSVEDIKKNLKITLDQETQSKLIINLSPEAKQSLTPLSNIPSIPLNPVEQLGQPLDITNLQSSAINLDSASTSLIGMSDIFGSVITNLQSIIEQAKITPDNLGNAVAQATQDTSANDFIKTISDKISELVSTIQTQSENQQQVATEQKSQEIKIDGLDNVQEATSKNSEALADANQNISSLTDQLSKTEDALAKGVNLTLDTVQQVNVDVTGIPEEIEGIGERLRVVARDIAKDIILNVLDDLEKSAQDTNTAISFANAKSALG
jgi:TP901 family phage tail tape measure protein